MTSSLDRIPSEPSQYHEPCDFPVALRLSGKRCLVLGSSAELETRVRGLLASGARVDVFTPSLDRAQSSLLELERCTVYARDWQPADLEDCWLVLVTNPAEVDVETLATQCESRRILYCVTDQPKWGNFRQVALARADLLWAAIGTSGRVPALSARLARLLQRLFDRSDLGAIARRLERLRQTTSAAERREVMLRATQQLKLEGQLLETRNAGESQ